MEMLTIENLIDLREAVTRRYQDVALAETEIPEAVKEQQRKKKSLSESLCVIEERIKDLQFELERQPGHKEGDDVYKCPACHWEGFRKDMPVMTHGSNILPLCPFCDNHNVQLDTKSLRYCSTLFASTTEANLLR